MSKKGFTLIELLAVIIIVSVVAMITFPDIIDLINNTNTNIYKENENRLSKIADIYMAKKLIPYPIEGEKVTVTLQQMQSIDLIGTINDISGEGTCDGFVEITTRNKANTFRPFITCGTNYTTPGYNGLKNPMFTANGDGAYDYFRGISSYSNGYVAAGDSDSTTVDMLGRHLGGKDAIIYDLDTSGNVRWMANYGGSQNDYFRGVVSNDTMRIAAGYSASTDFDMAGMNKGGWDGIIVRYDTNGNIVWKKNHGGTSTDFLNDIQMASDGFVVVGYSWSTNGDLTGLNKGGQDAIIAKYDFNGNIVWKANFGGSSTDEYYRVFAATDGYYATGYSYSIDKDVLGLHNGANTSYADAIIVKYDLNGNVLWKKNFGGMNHDFFEGAASNATGIIASGYSYSNDVDLTGLHHGTTSAYDAIVVQYDLNGNVVWKKNYGGTSNDYYHAAEADTTGYTMFGRTYSTDLDIATLSKGGWDAIAVRYDLSGNIVWKKNFGSSSTDIAYNGTLVSDGYLFVGYTSGSDKDMANKLIGNDDAMLYKIDLSGNITWNKNYGGGPGYDYLTDVVETKTGFVVVGQAESKGSIFTGKNKGYADAIILSYDYDGNLLWNNNYGGANSYDYFFAVDSDSTGIIAAGYSASSNGDLQGISKGGYDGSLVKYDLNGNMLWKKAFGGSSSDYFYDLEAVNDGYIVVGYAYSSNLDLTGLHNGTTSYLDGIIVKYDLNGNVVWKKNFGGTNHEYFYGVTAADDGYIVAGVSYSTDGDLTGLHYGTTAYYDAILVKYDLNGNLVWKKNFGGTNNDYYREVVENSLGYVVVGYSYSNDVDLTGLHYNTVSSTDGIIVQYDFDGNILWKKNFGSNSSDFFQAIELVNNELTVVGRGEAGNVDLTGLNRGSGDVIVVKYDLSGNVLAKKNYGGSDYDSGDNITPVRDGFIFVGVTNSITNDLLGVNNTYYNNFIGSHKW